MAIDAEAFYRTMSPPDAPNERMLAQSKLVVPASDPAVPTAPRGPDEAEAAARRFYGHQDAQDRVEPKPEATQEAPDEPDELSDVQREHEERRQAEADRAERMYGDLPMDGVRYDEPEMTGPAEFSFEPPPDLAGNLAEGEGAQIVQSFVDAGVGRTLAGNLVQQGIEAARRGPLAPEVVERRNGDTMAALTAKWGDRTAEKLAEARGMIAVAEKRWPNIKDFLDRSGLGSDPKLIQQLVARAERRPGRKR